MLLFINNNKFLIIKSKIQNRTYVNLFYFLPLLRVEGVLSNPGKESRLESVKMGVDNCHDVYSYVCQAKLVQD